MSHQELKQYVLEIISHQINDTIGKEEEMEAWREMSDFFGEQFEIIILEIQAKYIDDKNVIETEIDSHFLIEIYFFISFELLHHSRNSSHPTYLFSLDQHYFFQATLFFVSENLFLFQKRFYRRRILFVFLG